MGMSFEEPDFDAIKEERQKSSNKEVSNAKTPDFEFMYMMQKFEPTEFNTGIRQMFYNRETKEWRMKKQVGEIIRDERRTNVKIPTWDWDGEAYKL